MLASSVAILTLVAPVQASCFTYNYGATYREDVGGAAYSGVKAYEDFQSADVPHTYLVAHPIQVDTASGDFVGWGTYQGYGTDDPVENCPDDYNAHWKIYVDGVSHGVQFCDVGFGSLSFTAFDQLFNVNYGSCNGTNQFRGFLNGTREWCSSLNSVNYIRTSVGGEAGHLDLNVPPINQYNQHIDIDYTGIQRHATISGDWFGFDSTSTFCVDVSYGLLHNPADSATPIQN